MVGSLEAARARLAAIRPDAYARTRNSIDGAVTGLSPYITHGFLTLPEVLAAVNQRHHLPARHKFVYELGWREFFRHVWHHRGAAIFHSLHQGPLPDDAYAKGLPTDIREGRTGVPVVDQAVRQLYLTGTLHNHARMWLASYVVHLRKIHWRTGADWLYAHLLDGDLASNHLSWQWIAGTGSSKPYLFNAENVARYAPANWHSPGTILDTSYEALDQFARTPRDRCDSTLTATPGLLSEPPEYLGATAPDATITADRDVWLVHPWSLGELPADLPPDTLVIALFLADFHRAWPWSEARWRWIAPRISELTPHRWFADAASVAEALTTARTVRSIAAPHLKPWLEHWADCRPQPTLFPAVDKLCTSFSQWWKQASRGLQTAAELSGQHSSSHSPSVVRCQVGVRPVM